jgi:protein TonB
MAAAGGAPTPALDGLPSGEDPASPENSPELAAIADPGSYEALVISDDGPLPATAAPPAGNETVAASGTNAAAGSPPTPADRGPQSATAAAPAQAGATGAPGVAGATAPAIAAAPVRIQPAPDIRPVTPARLVGGSLLNSDNQRGAFQGTVSVRFTVTPGGRATGCRPTGSSGNARLDAHTCELVEQRLQFAPAQTAQGRAVSSEVGATYTWGRKRRTITGRLLDLVR